jgi:hypothetical protein
MTQPPRPFRNFDPSHVTKQGVPKRALTHAEVAQICADNPQMRGYLCITCNKLHVGNRGLAGPSKGQVGRPRKEVA